MNSLITYFFIDRLNKFSYNENNNDYHFNGGFMSTIKYSRQREAIKEYLSSTKEHPTADTVYIQVRKTFPNISLGTVYRNLNLLVDQGEAIKIECKDGCDHFDATCSPHYHFVCNKCNAVLDLEVPNLDHINTLANATFEGDIQGHSVLFYGICPACKQGKTHKE